MLYPQAVPPLALQVQEFVPLAPYTTFRIGGLARFFAEVTTEAELLEAVDFARQRHLKIFTLGGGSNLLVSDSGFDGLVIHIATKTPTQIIPSGNFVDFAVAAGTDWNAFVLEVCQQGISGVECLAGIPGSVGGTPVQNVGAYGQEVASTITLVRTLDLESNAFIALSHDECGFAYRRSLFNTTHRNRYIVTQVNFRFDCTAKPNLTYADLERHFAGQATVPTPLDVYHAVRAIRHGKGMLIVEGEADCRSAGSFFKNPVVEESVLADIAATLQIPAEKIPHWPAGEGRIKLPAAWLLERAGFVKGFTLGEAGISSRHTLALINRGHATAADIVALRETIRQQVEDRFHILLEQEPVELSHGEVMGGTPAKA
jgi:UDP-N-acetylmuramate dehydrogenase